jgi:hypothetical protein
MKTWFGFGLALGLAVGLGLNRDIILIKLVITILRRMIITKLIIILSRKVKVICVDLDDDRGMIRLN